MCAMLLLQYNSKWVYTTTACTTLLLLLECPAYIRDPAYARDPATIWDQACIRSFTVHQKTSTAMQQWSSSLFDAQKAVTEI